MKYEPLAQVLPPSFAYISVKNGLPESYEQWKIVVIGSVSGGFLATLTYFIWCIVSVLIVSKESNGLLGKHEYEVTEEGLFEKTIANETLNRWESLGKVMVECPLPNWSPLKVPRVRTEQWVGVCGKPGTRMAPQGHKPPCSFGSNLHIRRHRHLGFPLGFHLN